MIEALHEIFSPERVRTDADTLGEWGRDWTRNVPPAPSAVVFPRTVAEIAELVGLAAREGWPLVPSGGRTGLSGGAVAGSGEIVVSLDRMNRILDFDATDRIARCEAGVVTQTLQAFAEEQGLSYPVDFASSGSSQIGGNVATNAGGIKVIRYGLTRDWVAGLTVVAGNGEVLELNHGLVKNATGYDFRHLFVGSEGTLGIIAGVDVRLAPAPAPQTVMVVGVPNAVDLLSVLGAFQARLELSAFEFFSELALTKVLAHRDLQRPLAEPVAYYALMEFDESALDAAMDGFEHVVGEGWAVDGVVSQSGAQAASLWALREGISESIASYTPYKNDLSVRISQVPEFLADVDRFVTDSYPDLEVCWYGHIGDGNLHLNILKPPEMSVDAFYERCHALSPEIFRCVAERQGSISAEHGVGTLKRDFLGYTRSDAEIALMRQVKQAFDPAGIMNPGKLLG